MSMSLSKIIPRIRANDPTLTEANLWGVNAKEAQALAKAIEVNRSLIILKLYGRSKLNIYGNNIGLAGTQTLAKALKVNCTLQHIRFHEIKIGNAGAQFLAEALKVNCTLITIDFFHNAISSVGFQELMKSLKVNRNLGFFSFTVTGTVGSNIKDLVGIQALAEALKINCTLRSIRLTSVDLVNGGIDDIGAQVLGEALKVNHTLRALNLRGGGIGNAGAEFLAEALKVNCALTAINLSRNNIGPRGAQALAGALKVNHTLTAIYFRDNHIGGRLFAKNEGIKDLVEAIKVNCTLASIDLCDNNIRDACAQAIVEALEVNHTMMDVKLGDNRNILFATYKKIETLLVRNRNALKRWMNAFNSPDNLNELQRRHAQILWNVNLYLSDWQEYNKPQEDNSRGRTILIWAVRCRRSDIVAWLLDFPKLDITSTILVSEELDKTPLELALDLNYSDIATLILNAYRQRGIPIPANLQCKAQEQGIGIEQASPSIRANLFEGRAPVARRTRTYDYSEEKSQQLEVSDPSTELSNLRLENSQQREVMAVYAQALENINAELSEIYQQITDNLQKAEVEKNMNRLKSIGASIARMVGGILPIGGTITELFSFTVPSLGSNSRRKDNQLLRSRIEELQGIVGEALSKARTY